MRDILPDTLVDRAVTALQGLLRFEDPTILQDIVCGNDCPIRKKGENKPQIVRILPLCCVYKDKIKRPFKSTSEAFPVRSVTGASVWLKFSEASRIRGS